MKNFTYDDVIKRLQYYRNKNHLSARETSLRLGYSDTFINRVERGLIELKISTLLDFLELVNVSVEEFFSASPNDYAKDRELLEVLKNTSYENKLSLIDIAKRLK